MMLETFTDLIRRLVKALNMSRCDYMFTGALAASYYGRPRTTLDVDLVIAAEERDLDRLTKWLGSAGLVVEKEGFNQPCDREIGSQLSKIRRARTQSISYSEVKSSIGSPGEL